jgi:thymidylate kinase
MEQYKSKDLLILDRHPYSSDYAYGYGLNESDKEAIAMIRIFEALQIVIPCLTPDPLFVIDISPNIAADRVSQRGKQTTIIEV